MKELLFRLARWSQMQGKEMIPVPFLDLVKNDITPVPAMSTSTFDWLLCSYRNEWPITAGLEKRPDLN